jgi:fermentation-respiration switch protein FrsA (DUF1100 family)
MILGTVTAVGPLGCRAVENSLVYHPAHTCVQEESLPEAAPRISLHSADGVAISARWFPYAGARGAVLYCHGNAGDLDGRAREVCALGRTLGESVLLFDYPGFGQSAGRPDEAGCHAAAEAAYDWLVGQRAVRPEDVLIYGESLGGGVAVHLAARRPHRALILVRTFTSLPDVAQGLCPWLPVHWLMSNRFNNLEEIGRCRQPTFIARGEADRLIPFAHGERLYAAADGPAFLFTLRGADHNDPLGPDFYAALRTFLQAHEPRP